MKGKRIKAKGADDKFTSMININSIFTKAIYMEEDHFFLEISDSGDFLRVTPLKRINYNSDEYWDNNWISTRIEVKSGCFKGEYIAQLMSIDFKHFKDKMHDLYNDLKGVAEFHDLERYLTINITGDGIGHFVANCRASDDPGIYGTTLEFDLSFDQTQIMPMVRQLDLITIQFPVVGK